MDETEVIDFIHVSCVAKWGNVRRTILQLFELTGCLSSCAKSEYHIVRGWPAARVNRRVPAGHFELHFVFAKGRYVINKQYYVYDSDSLIADVGGYLGLLLGQSLLGLYQLGVSHFPCARWKNLQKK